MAASALFIAFSEAFCDFGRKRHVVVHQLNVGSKAVSARDLMDARKQEWCRSFAMDPFLLGFRASILNHALNVK